MTDAIPTPAFEQSDRDLLALFTAQSEGLRAGLVMLARIGVGWRRAAPERCRSWIAQVETHPLYKGGQTLFDLLELEDFMLDGSPEGSADALADLLASIARALGIPAVAAPAPADLPPLEAGFYLYRDVALGLVSALLETRRLAAPFGDVHTP